MPDMREVELRIAVAEGLLSRPEADQLAEEARRKELSPLVLLVQQGRMTEASYQSLFAAALADPVWRAEGREGSASTFTMSAPPPSSNDDPPFPVAAWDRYSNVRFLGQGGMGKVYLAVDTRLRREVAIKFVRGDDAEHVRRLIAEARTQAHVIHDRICKVYEVGEVEGKVYIAMQYIHGKPLGKTAGELTLEQKVMLVRGAAEGIHEAHRVGIVHRDIKPSNIMVERSDDGEIRPYVMDFGLAHSAQDAGSTQTGAVLGTPRYMAPEQAHGSAATLDRRADVYSLGATLYHLLTGEPPVPGETIAEVIHNLVAVEPRPLRAIDHNIPIDLEAIVLKCLEKERSARYDSARALADDLGRFLNGEPVLARPAGTWYRLRKRMAKNRRLVVASAAALIALGVAIGWGIKTRLDAGEGERLARQFAEKVVRIEALARESGLSPQHDIRRDRKALRDRMAEIEADIRQAGDAAAGPGHYALGRGYLALDDDERARGELEAAWQADFHEPQAAYALALVMGHLYRRGLLAAERIENKDRREAQKRDIERQFRDPALDYLNRSRGAETPSPEYVAALVAFYEGRLEDALNHINQIGDGLPWFWEAPELRGDILFARAGALRRRGEIDGARSDFDAGRAAYAAAATIGRSVPAVTRSLADMEHGASLIGLYTSGDVTPLERALAAAERTLAIMPDDHDALVLEARIRRTQAEHGAIKGVSVEDLLGKALDDARRAVALAPGRSQAHLEMAEIYRQWADVRLGRSLDPSAQVRNALDAADKVLERDRDAQYYACLGLALSIWAAYEHSGASAQAHFDKASEAFTRALELDDTRDSVRINFGVMLWNHASWRDAKDPDGDLQRAFNVFEIARSRNPKHYVPYYYEGKIYAMRAKRAGDRGEDPDPDLERALDAYTHGGQLNPKAPHLRNGIGGVLTNQALAAWDHGKDPEPFLERARRAFEEAVGLAPDQEFGYANVGEVFAQRARYQRLRGEDPSASVRDAMTWLSQATKLVPDNPTYWADIAMIQCVFAEYALDHGRDPRPSLRQASEAIDTARKRGESDPQVQFYLGETQGLAARLAAREGRARADDFASAANAFANAIAIAPGNAEYKLALGQLHRAWAAWQRDPGVDPGGPLRRGLDLVQQALRQRPGWPDALVVRGSLSLLQARNAAPPAQRAQLASSAARDIADALAVNPALTGLWAAPLQQAQQLAATH